MARIKRPEYVRKPYVHGSGLTRPSDVRVIQEDYDHMVMALTLRYAQLNNIRIQTLADGGIKISGGKTAAERLYVKQMLNRAQIQLGAERFVEHLDRGAVVDTTSPLQRVATKTLSSGERTSRIIQTSNRSLFLTPEEKAKLALARKLAALEKRLINLAFRETEAAREQGRKALRDYVELIGKVFLQNEIKTSRQLLRILAASHAASDAAVLKAVSKHLGDALREVSKLEIYMTAMQRVQQQSFYLWIQDKGLLESNYQMAEVLKRVSFEIGTKLPNLIIKALQEAFTEAWTGIDDDAFPAAYRKLIWDRIKDPSTIKKLRVSGNLTSPTAAWVIIADFEDIFGNRADLEKGFHFAAIESEDRLTYTKKNSVSRVRLPYHAQNLKNPVGVRYAFWLAIWKNQKYYSPYFTGSDRKEHYAKGTKRLEALNKRKATLEKQIEAAKRRQSEAVHVHVKQYGRLTSEERAMTQAAIDEESINIDIAHDRIAQVERAISYSQKHRFSQPKKIKNATELKNKTIDERYKYWKRVGKAPIWLYLEFGQLKYAPIIPPRGVYYRFLIKIKKAVREEVRKAQNKQASQFYGYTVDTSFGKTVAPTPAGGDIIQFWISDIGPRGETTQRRAAVGEKLPEKFYRAYVTLKSPVERTIAEAERIGALTTAARQSLAAADAEMRKAIADAKGVAGKMPVSKTGKAVKYYNYGTRKGMPRPMGSVVRPEFHASPYSGIPASRGGSGSISAPSYTPRPFGGTFTDRELAIYEGMPNKGLKMAYLKRAIIRRKMRKLTPTQIQERNYK